MRHRSALHAKSQQAPNLESDTGDLNAKMFTFYIIHNWKIYSSVPPCAKAS